MFKLLNLRTFVIGSQSILKIKYSGGIQWNISNKISTKSKNHYETLNLSRNCTSKEIRDAFITLSKQYHPDKNKGNPKAQEEFVKVNEAYNVLIKPVSRQEYDFTLNNFSNPSRVFRTGKKDDYYEVHRYDSNYRDPWKDPSFYKNRKFNEEDKDSYYGVRGIKKQSNDTFLFWILIFAGVGLFLQISIIRFTNPTARRDRKTEENQRYLDYVKERAEFYGTRERQIEAFLHRSGHLQELETDTKAKPDNEPG